MIQKDNRRAVHAGRYAPSPTGDLHKGSLLAALAAFFQARSHKAPWYMRVDDLDTPRVIPGKSLEILNTLEAFGLHWDGAVLYQSRRNSIYEDVIARLNKGNYLFDCGCTRREARAGPYGPEGPIYPGTCRYGLPAGRAPRSVRIKVGDATVAVTDGIQGHYSQCLAADIGDFVLRRADGIVAYQLATVVDDAAQGVAEVVRGADLMSSTPRQIFLNEALGHARLTYAHVPILVDRRGRKLGKSNGALALDRNRRSNELVEALMLLGQTPPQGLAAESIDRIIEWGIDHWQLEAVPARTCINVEDTGAMALT